MTAAGGPRIAALNEAAEAEGLKPGGSLADARAQAQSLQVRTVDPVADSAALRRLALWATRYTPTASPWSEENGADGFFLDIEGAAHLFGGEEMLIADLASRLQQNFSLPARLAVAATPGTAWALSRFHAAPLTVLPSGEEAAALAPLPVEALRLSAETCTALRRLGMRVRVYAPVGDLVAGMAYLVRRLLENTSNDSFLQEQARGAAISELLAKPEPSTA